MHEIKQAFLQSITPDIKLCKDEIEQSTFLHRNKDLFLNYAITLIFYIISAIYSIATNSSTPDYTSIFIILFLSSLFILTLRFHPKIYGYIILVILFSSLIAAFFDMDLWIHVVHIGALLPLFILVVTKDMRLTFITAISLMGWNIIFRDHTIEVAQTIGLEQYIIKSITNIMSQIWFCVWFVYRQDTIQRLEFKKTQEIAEQNRSNEKHKLLLLSFSHELRNLIQSLIGQISLIDDESIKTQESKNYLKTAKFLGDLLVHQINNILDSGKVDVEDLEITPKTQNTFKVFKNIWDICSKMIFLKKLYGIICISKQVPEFLELDEHRLMQIILNLVGNSTKFTTQGSVTIQVDWFDDNSEQIQDKHFEPIPFCTTNNSPEQEEIEQKSEYFANQSNEQASVFERQMTMAATQNDYIKFYLNHYEKGLNASFSAENLTFTHDTSANQQTKGILKIVIKDTGSGIKKENIPKLFQIFSQVGSNKSKKSGAGLGLFISKHLIQKMGGEIRIYSKEKVGTVFTICLPVCLGQAQTDNKPDISQENPGYSLKNTKIRCMIVDDELFIRTFLSNMLVQLDIEIQCQGRDGIEAFNLYKQAYEEGKRLELITMDINMPKMNGKEAVKLIRKFEVEQNINPPCRIVFITGNYSASEYEECVERNGNIRASTFLRKPVSKLVLQNCINQHCKQE